MSWSDVLDVVELVPPAHRTILRHVLGYSALLTATKLLIRNAVALVATVTEDVVRPVNAWWRNRRRHAAGRRSSGRCRRR